MTLLEPVSSPSLEVSRRYVRGSLCVPVLSERERLLQDERSGSRHVPNHRVRRLRRPIVLRRLQDVAFVGNIVQAMVALRAGRFRQSARNGFEAVSLRLLDFRADDAGWKAPHGTQ